MSELTLLVFRIAFLIALWVFVFFVVYAVRSDLFGYRTKKLPSGSSKNTAAASPRKAFLTDVQTPVSPGNINSSVKQDSAPTITPLGSIPPRTYNPGEESLELVITSGPNEGASIELSDDTVNIGRASDSTIVIRDDYTSTHHARLERRKGQWWVSDVGSTNGTFVAGQRIHTPTVLTPGTALSIGATTFEIRSR